MTLLVLTSNRGLAGGLNTNLLKLAHTVLAEQRAAGAAVSLHVVRDGIFRAVRPDQATPVKKRVTRNTSAAW